MRPFSLFDCHFAAVGSGHSAFANATEARTLQPSRATCPAAGSSLMPGSRQLAVAGLVTQSDANWACYSQATFGLIGKARIGAT
jgi:hypothetical protein